MGNQAKTASPMNMFAERNSSTSPFLQFRNPRQVSRLLWALVLVTLPVTSFRFMPFMGTGTYVRPLAIYPLVILLPVLLLRLKRGEISRPWPGALTMVLAFLLAALAATAFGATLAPLELRGADFYDRALRAVITLGVGLSFFLAAVWMNQDEADLKFSVRWLMLGLAVDLAWGAIQFIGLNTGHRQQLYQIQNLFSVRGLVKNKRISGFAFEPSWLAGQISTLYLPWLLAALLTRYRALEANHTPRLARSLVSLIEPLLLLLALGGVLMTYSRSGLFIVLVAALVTFALTGKPALLALWGWVLAGFQRSATPGRWKTLRASGSRVLLALLIVAMLTGAATFLANKGYIATFFQSDKSDWAAYAVDVYLGPRLAYATAALSAFDKHPLTGVGLGASGFAIYQNMPDWVLAGVPEISEQMAPTSTLYPNPKNLYVRLLTETGLPGLLLFLLFYLILFADCLTLLRNATALDMQQGAHNTQSPTPDMNIKRRWLATAGIFALIAIVLQGVSQDSFAMPEMWICLGMLAGAAGAFQNQNSKKKQDLL
jgi:O-antigen ligase